MQKTACGSGWEGAAHDRATEPESAPLSPAILLAQATQGSGGALTAGTYNTQLLPGFLRPPNKTLLAWRRH